MAIGLLLILTLNSSRQLLLKSRTQARAAQLCVASSLRALQALSEKSPAVQQPLNLL